MTGARIAQFLREPMIHFLFVGLLLFGLFSWLGIGFDSDRDASDDSRRVVVERRALLDFIRSKMRIADPAASERAFDALDPDTRRDWIDRYVREEILVREARALGLDRGDELIRRRLAQKIEFLTVGILDEELRIDEAGLEAYYQRNREAYRLPARLSFTHVFFRGRDDGDAGEEGDTSAGVDADPTGGSEARARAEALLRDFNARRAGAPEAAGQGDHFLYNRNYVDRTIGEIRSHFGEDFVRSLEAATPDDGVWVGPFRSVHGWHVVLISRKTDSRIPPLAGILPLVRQDARREKREAALEKALEGLASKYEIELAPDLDPSS